MVTFNQPIYLVLAICLIPSFLFVSALVRRFHKNAIGKFGQRETLRRFPRFSSKVTTTLLLTLSLASMVIAAAEPSLSRGEDGSTRTLNAIIVLDVSRSMLAEDGPKGMSRFETGIAAVEKLLETYPDGRFGLVIYTSQVVDYSPTFDHQALRVILHNVRDDYTEAIRGEGSDATLALDTTVEMIEDLPYTVNTVFLISDGGKSLASNATTSANQVEMMRSLTNQRVHLIVIGIGELIPSAIPVYAEDGVLIGYHQYEGMIVYTALDEIPLKRLADETGGSYLRLTDIGDLVQITQSENLDSQPIAQDSTANLVWLPVAISILLILVHLVNPRS